MNYSQAMKYLEKTNQLGSVLGLESIQKLLELLGNPQKELKIVHVAGTNGKGSVISFLQNILMQAGYKVGRYSSPAVFNNREIIRINNVYIEEQQYADILSDIRDKCIQMVEEGLAHPTSFEIETALAFMYFKQRQCDIALIECGMGGESDATNVFDKVLCSIITTISLDHIGVLGDTVSEIAKVKSGIIKKECPVVVSRQDSVVQKVLQQKAKENKSNIIIANPVDNFWIENMRTHFEYTANDNTKYTLTLKALGTYQIKNAVTALEAALVLDNKGFKVKKYIESGIYNTKWEGRLEIIHKEPLIVIDGAHNPGAVEELKRTMDLYFTNKRITFIMGVLADKDFDREAAIIAKRANNIITVTPNNPRALDGRILAETIKKYNRNVIYTDNIGEALRIAKQSVMDKKSDMILAFGSLSYLGQLKQENIRQTVKAERRD